MAMVETLLFPAYIAQEPKRHVIITVLKNTMISENVDGLLKFKQEEEVKLRSALDQAQNTMSNDDADYMDKLTGYGNVLSSVEDSFTALSATAPVAKIVLPMPNTFTDNHQHSWNVSKGLAAEVASMYLEGNIATKLAKGVAIAADSANLRKPLVDPGFFQSYSGTQPRNFSFMFELVPNSATEAKTIIKIMKMLRKYSLPSTMVNHAVLLSPHYFSIKFGNDTLDKAINARDVVLTGINVDYGADGGMQFLADGTPKQMTLNLTFAERKMTVENTYII